MNRRIGRFGHWAWCAAAIALLVAGHAALAQGRGGGSIVFTVRRPPRDMVGNLRGWANSNHATSYNEDVAVHAWHVNFMVFLPRPPNVAEITLAWFHVAPGSGPGTYVSNEPIALSDPTQRVFVHNTTLRRAAGEFEPMERYEAVLSVNDARGTHEVARGRIQLVGQVERHSGVVDFTGDQPTTH